MDRVRLTSEELQQVILDFVKSRPAGASLKDIDKYFSRTVFDASSREIVGTLHLMESRRLVKVSPVNVYQAL